MPSPLRLGVNIDHVATVRNARGGAHPDPVHAAHVAVAAGADGITAHLREDRRHIRGDDVDRLMAELTVPLNLEAAATAEMVAIAVRLKPHAVCLVPERREERTTEGGLDIIAAARQLRPVVAELKAAGIRVSLFVEADRRVMDMAAELGAPVVELHTGTYCERFTEGSHDATRQALAKLSDAAAHGHRLGLEIHAGHGLTTASVGPIAAIDAVAELNIGHFLIGEAITLGLPRAIADMRQAMVRARSGV